jgi:hypothetical protein
MKCIGLLCLAMVAACQTPQPASASRPLMDSALAAKICTNPGAVSVLGADCLMRDQSPPARLLPPSKFPK